MQSGNKIRILCLEYVTFTLDLQFRFTIAKNAFVNLV
jgi:hypothetical protein